MCDCDFTKDTPPASVLDPRKRVRHFAGLVMGADEFQQDQLYFMARDELHQRALHGYGVVSGLGVQVRPDDDTGDPEVVVAAGVAVNPRGETICVPQAQCAELNKWLEEHRDELLGSPPALPPEDATLYLVLCARDCETDQVPVLGDPCRTLEDATAASRIADDFALCLRLEPPIQIEEEAVRRLGDLLRSIEISDAPGGLSPEDLAGLVRDLVPSGSPPELGEIDLGSPPLELTLHPDDAADALAAAYRVWIHEVRPALNPETGACEVPRDGADGRCLLLACLTFDYADGADGLEVTGSVEIDSAKGPILVQTRVLQELLLGWIAGSVTAPPTASPPLGDGGGLASPPEIGPISHGDLLDLDGDDHLRYLLVDPTDRSLIADLDASDNLVVGLGEPETPANPAPATGSEAVRWDRAVKNGDAAGGDLAGTYPDPDVVRLQSNPVAPGALGGGDAGRVLTWSGAMWVPGELPLEPELVRVIDLSWSHDGNTLLRVTHNENGNDVEARGLVIGFGQRRGQRRQIDPQTIDNNVFRVFMRGDPISSGGVAGRPLLELQPSEVIPVRVRGVLPNGLINRTQTPANPPNGAFFRIDGETASALVERRQRLFVRLSGDHVLDRDGRAIDAEFPRAGFPSGDGPGAAELGIQGGGFESWVVAGLRAFPIDGRDVNRADVDELSELPGIGPILGGRIVELREARGGFTRFEELREVPGLSDTVFENLRRLLDDQ